MATDNMVTDKSLKLWAAMAMALALGACNAREPIAPTASTANRMIVLTDIEADPDDTQSLVRLMLYANEIEIEGLIATTSVHQKDRIAPESIHAVLDAYEQVRPSLTRHANGYPTAGAMRALVKSGAPLYGMEGVGEGQDTEGSNWIISVLEEADERPLWVSVWGGPNVLAQALFRIRASRSADEAARLIAKLRVYTISDQDDSAIWIRREFPDLFYIVSPGGYGASIWGGIMQTGTSSDAEISTNWIAENIQQGHGPFGAIYPDVAYGVEGDTPAFLGLIPNGLNVPEHPDWGGWGGRYEFYRPQRAALDPNGFTGGVPVEEEPRAIWTNAIDRYQPHVANEYGRAVRVSDEAYENARVTLWRWRADFQNDFAARMDWTIRAYADANHPPIAALAHEDAFEVASGQSFYLDAAPSTDPDGDSLSFLWINYAEPGSLDQPIAFASAENLRRVRVVAPEVDKPETVHFIVRVTDKGSPALSRYRRIVVTINPS